MGVSVNEITRKIPDAVWIRVAEWVGVAGGIAGAVLIAANVSISGWAYVPFLIGSVLLLIVFHMRRRWAQVALWAAYTIINILGLYRWLLCPHRHC